MSNKFSFIDAKSYELSKIIVSRIPEYEVIDEVIYNFKDDKKQVEDNKINNTIQNKVESNFDKQDKKIPNAETDNENNLLPSPKKILDDVVEHKPISSVELKPNESKDITLNKKIEENKGTIMKDFSKLNNNLRNDITDSTEPVSAISAFNDIDFNVMQDFDNIVNINDVYDDLGRAFQDDLNNQYSQLDKFTSQDDVPKYSYLPKRKIKDILLGKHGIDNEECVNELYSMAFNNKWREIDVEHWLLNPANLSALVDKYLPKKEDISKVEQKTTEKKDEPSNSVVDENKPSTSVENKIYVPVKQEKEYIDRHQHDGFHHPHHHYFNPYFNPYTMMLNNQQNNINVKDDMKAVLVEENYRKMQFDYQTEIIKNHIDHKINDVLNSQKNNDVDSNNKNNSSSKNSSINNLSDEELNEKITSIFDVKKDELVNEMNELKTKFEENEKVVFDALDFIRKEIKENESNINNNLSETLKEMKQDIGSTLAQYIKELNDKQNDFVNIINDKQIKVMDDISNKQNQLENQITSSLDLIDAKQNQLENQLNNSLELINSKQNSIVEELLDKVKTNDEDLKLIDVISNDFNSKFKTISDELNLIKNNIDTNNKNNSMGMNDFQLELTNQLNNVSSEMKNSITNLYDEIENINATISNLKQAKNDSVVANKKDEDEIEKPSVSLGEYIKNVETKNEIKDIEPKAKLKQNKQQNNTNNQLEDEFKNIPLIDTDNNSFDYQKDFKNPKYIIQETKEKPMDLDLLKSSTKDIEEFEVDEFEYDKSDLTDEDKDFYKSFLDNNSVDQQQSNLVSNFDANSKITSIDIERQEKVIEKEETNKKDEKGFDIKSKLSKIDEIIKNSIDELNDIKEYVDEDNAKIDDSIKLFEQVKQ